MPRKKTEEKNEEAFFAIGVMARLLDVPTQRIRQIEKEGFLEPQRTSGKTRLYTQTDLERARIVLTLMDELGVNAAGVEIILNMRSQMENMQSQMQKLLTELLGYVDKEDVFTKSALVPRGDKAITILKILKNQEKETP